MSGNLLQSSLAVLFAWCVAVTFVSAEDNAHLERLGAPAWHARGISGKGVTVAILDNGFRSYRTQLGATLPQRVETRSFREDGNLEARDSIHGLLCAEVVHTIAPDAKLLFANWEPDDPRSFLKAVAWARQRGATIISCSIVMPGWSDGLGGGEVHRELSNLLDGVLFFASAGNLAQRHWTGAFRDDGNGRHVWNQSQTQNAVIPWDNQPVSVELVARSAAIYRLTVVDDEGKPIETTQAPLAPGVHGSAVRFAPKQGKRYRASVELVSGTGGELRLIALGGELEHTTSTGCMVFPGDGNDVMAVGAVSLRNERLPYSSTGSAGRFAKPVCVAPVPFPSRIRHDGFDGTSAASPQAAGVAALMWSRDTRAQAVSIRSSLSKCCVDTGVQGLDAETGHGVIHLPCP